MKNSKNIIVIAGIGIALYTAYQASKKVKTISTPVDIAAASQAMFLSAISGAALLVALGTASGVMSIKQ